MVNVSILWDLEEAGVCALLGSVAWQSEVNEESCRFEEGYYVKYLPALAYFYLLGGGYTPSIKEPHRLSFDFRQATLEVGRVETVPRTATIAVREGWDRQDAERAHHLGAIVACPVNFRKCHSFTSKVKVRTGNS